MYYLYEAFSGEVFVLGVSIGVPLQSLGDPCSTRYTTVEGGKGATYQPLVRYLDLFVCCVGAETENTEGVRVRQLW